VAPEQVPENIRIPGVGNFSSPDLPWKSIDAHRTDLREETNQGNLASQATPRKIHSRKVEIALAIIDRHEFTRVSIAKSLQKLCNQLEITTFVTFDECLVSTKHYDLVLYYMREGIAGRNANQEQFSSLRKVLSIAPVIVLSDVDSYASICAAFDVGVRGYIPTMSTPPEVAIEIMYLVRSGGTFVPPTGLSSRGISSRETLDRVAAQQFTPRQRAVLDCLKLGKTNKIIAYELQISESSVKTHIRNIMTKMNAKNRTEVACRAHEL
jgi:DNA-binding NarL/FixJ family response regulator